MKIELRNSANYQFAVDMDRSSAEYSEKARERLETVGDAICLVVGTIIAWAWLVIL